MMKKIIFSIFVIMSVFLVACNEDAGFSSSPDLRLEFSCDTVAFDTLFTDLSSPTAMFVVHNRNKNSLRVSDIRLASGGESGFNVLVDGEPGNVVRDIEIRAKDSIYVLASVKLDRNGTDMPLMVKDSLLFTLESGVGQYVLLMAYGRDVTFMHAPKFTTDTILAAGHYVVYDSLVVGPESNLALSAGTTLYFHDNAFMKIEGTLNAAGDLESPIVFRGDRTDRMFDYLPYDRVPGQWGGVTFTSTSNGNILKYCDIHSAKYGLMVELGDTTLQRLTVESSKIYNFTGHAMELQQAHASVSNTLIANAEGNCVKVVGGSVDFVHCTIANFYVWKQRDVALALHNNLEGVPAPLYRASFSNCIIAGTKDDELMGYFTEYGDTVPNSVNYYFSHSLINTVATDDSCFVSVVFDRPDSLSFAKEQFMLIDNEEFKYDFHLSEISQARRIASGEFLDILPVDVDGVQRTAEAVDAGCFVYREQRTEE